MNFPKSEGEPTSAVPPNSANRALILGSARAVLISLLSLSTSPGAEVHADSVMQQLAPPEVELKVTEPDLIVAHRSLP